MTHKTGSSKHEAGSYSGSYLFTIIGENGETGSHDCPADRGLGVTANCTFEDEAEIGKLVGLRIKNTETNAWVFVRMLVESNEGRVGSWSGNKGINDYQTKSITYSIAYRKIS